MLRIDTLAMRDGYFVDGKDEHNVSPIAAARCRVAWRRAAVENLTKTAWPPGNLNAGEW
jgi:hypothetical protein